MLAPPWSSPASSAPTIPVNQALRVLALHRAGRRERMQPRSPESLVGVDVPDAGDPRLRQQKGLERRLAVLGELEQPVRRELLRQRLDAEAGAKNSSSWSPASRTTAWPKRRTSVNTRVRPSSSSKRARTWLGSGAASYSRGPPSRSFFIRSAVSPCSESREQQVAGHPQVHGERATAFQPDQQVLPPPRDRGDLRPATARSSACGGSGRVSRSSSTDAETIRFPTSSGSSWRRTVSTSGNSGMP